MPRAVHELDIANYSNLSIRTSCNSRGLRAQTPSEQHNCLLVPLCVRARRAEVAAPFGFVVSDTLTSGRVFTRLFACLQGRHFASRAVQENFTRAAIAFEFGTDFDPRTRFRYGGCHESLVRYTLFASDIYTIYIYIYNIISSLMLAYVATCKTTLNHNNNIPLQLGAGVGIGQGASSLKASQLIDAAPTSSNPSLQANLATLP